MVVPDFCADVQRHRPARNPHPHNQYDAMWEIRWMNTEGDSHLAYLGAIANFIRRRGEERIVQRNFPHLIRGGRGRSQFLRWEMAAPGCSKPVVFKDVDRNTPNPHAYWQKSGTWSLQTVSVFRPVPRRLIPYPLPVG